MTEFCGSSDYCNKCVNNPNGNKGKMIEDNKLSVWKNKKTGNLYVVIYDEAIECTNGREDIDYTVYTSINDVKDMNGKIFVRQTNEFYQKFERVNL